MVGIWGNGSVRFVQCGYAVARLEFPFAFYSFWSTVIEALFLEIWGREQVKYDESLPEFVVTDAELSYAREFDDDQEVVFFRLPLSDVDAYETVLVDYGDVRCAMAEELSVILGREAAALVFTWIPEPNADLNICNSQTNLTGIIRLFGVFPIMIWFDIARFFKLLLHLGMNLLMGVENTEGASAYDDAVVF
jgi:hypothetical protein